MRFCAWQIRKEIPFFIAGKGFKLRQIETMDRGLCEIGRSVKRYSGPKRRASIVYKYGLGSDTRESTRLKRIRRHKQKVKSDGIWGLQ